MAVKNLRETKKKYIKKYFVTQPCKFYSKINDCQGQIIKNVMVLFLTTVSTGIAILVLSLQYAVLFKKLFEKTPKK